MSDVTYHFVKGFCFEGNLGQLDLTNMMINMPDASNFRSDDQTLVRFEITTAFAFVQKKHLKIILDNDLVYFYLGQHDLVILGL